MVNGMNDKFIDRLRRTVVPEPVQRLFRAILPGLGKGVPTLLVLGVLTGGWWVVQAVQHSKKTENDTDRIAKAVSGDQLTLSEAKWKVGHFKSVPVQTQSLQHVHSIPGRLRYDETKHVEVKTPLDGIITDILVTPGERVDLGQLLAVVRSPEIGQARATVLKRHKEREFAQQVLQRESVLAENLEELLMALDQGRSIDTIDSEFSNRPLGSYRQEILSAYATLRLSSELFANVQPLADSGMVSGRTLLERDLNRQLAESALQAVREQTVFAAARAKQKAEAESAEADRQYDLAWQSVETLLGYRENCQSIDLQNEDTLSRLEIRAPIAGSVESLGFANRERVSRNDSLVELANTDTLCVAASIRDGDWSALELRPGTKVTVSITALDDREFEAEVRYVGRTMQSESNAVPLVAAIQNKEGLLRPGMYARVTVPIGESRRILTVAADSIMRHETREFVFLDLSGGSFQRVFVSTRTVSDKWIEVIEGLSAGQLVVTDGAFLLKSELLLHGESE